ncbi:MAG: hypothetical protein NVSMB26_20420 [Beijerinckiaceae bacterium]
MSLNALDARLRGTRLVALAVLIFGAAAAGTIIHLFFLPSEDLLVRRLDTVLYAGGDYINLYVGAKLAVTGDVRLLFDRTAYMSALHELVSPLVAFHNWSYPPHLLLLIWPLAFLPYIAGFLVWSAVTFGALVAALPADNRAERWWLALAIAVSPAQLINLADGQNGCLTAAILLAGLRVMDKRPILAGILFGLLTIKPHLGIVIPFVLAALRHWRVAAAALGTAAALVFAAAAVFGTQTWASYLTVTSSYQLHLLEVMRGFYVIMMPSTYAAARVLGASTAVAIVLQLAISCGAVAAALIIVRRTYDVATRALAITAATFLASPYLLAYDMIALSAAIVLYVARDRPRSLLLSSGMIATWLSPAMVMYLMPLGIPFGPPALAILLAGLVDLVLKMEPDTASRESCSRDQQRASCEAKAAA